MSNSQFEPSLFPGTVLPHGVLLVVEAQSAYIAAVSESCLELLGFSAESILGQSLAGVFGAETECLLAAARRGERQSLTPLFVISESLFLRKLV